MLQCACVVYALFTLTDTRNRAFATRGCMPSPLANVCEGILESPLSQYDAARWREEGDRAAGRCSARREGRGGGIGRRAAARHGALSSLSLHRGVSYSEISSEISSERSLSPDTRRIVLRGARDAFRLDRKLIEPLIQMNLLLEIALDEIDGFRLKLEVRPKGQVLS